MTVVIAKGFRWVAGRDGIAHATSSRARQTRTLCGLLATDERFAQPAAVKCEQCHAKADGR